MSFACSSPAGGMLFGVSGLLLLLLLQQNLLEQKILKDRLCHFAFSIMDLTGYKGIMPPASITLSHDRPIFEAQRRHSEKEKKVEADKIEEMLQAGLIEPSISNKWCSNLTFPPKKAADGQWTEQRMCPHSYSYVRCTLY